MTAVAVRPMHTGNVNSGSGGRHRKKRVVRISEEIRVQYCGISSITELVPFSDSKLSSCTSNSYRYCDSYLSLARPHPSIPDTQLLFSPNHFWLDYEANGLCHVGIDEFLADVAGEHRRRDVCDVARDALSHCCPSLSTEWQNGR